MESARCSASIAHLVVPAPGCGRARNAASPKQRDAPEHGLRRDEIEDRLEERPRIALENLRDLRRHQRAGLRLAPGDDVGAQQRRRDRGAVALAARVGAEIGELLRRGRPVPDDVVGALAGLRLVVAAGHRVGEEQFAGRQAIGVVARTAARGSPAARRARRAWRARRHSRRTRAAGPAGTARARSSGRRRRRSADRRARACRRRKSR